MALKKLTRTDMTMGTRIMRKFLETEFVVQHKSFSNLIRTTAQDTTNINGKPEIVKF